MTVEAATYIVDLNITLPTGNDFVSEGDDHFRMLKAVLKNSFPNINAPVTVTPDQINDVVNKVLRSGDTMTGTLTAPGFISKSPDANSNPYYDLRLEDSTLKAQLIYLRDSGKLELRNWYSLSAYSYLTFTSSALSFNGNTVWHSGNDGASSGLDADTLDGVEGAGYALIDLSTTSDVTLLTKIKNVDGAGSGLDADTLDGIQGSGYALVDLSTTSDATLLTKIKNVDGAGSGLDADTLDGVQGSGYALIDLSTTSDATLLTKIKNVDGAGSGLDADLLDGAQPDVSPNPDTIAKRTNTGRLDAKGLMVEADGTGHAKTYLRNAGGAVAEIIKRNDGGAVELRCRDNADNIKSAWVAHENGWLIGWSVGGNKVGYNPTGARWEFYHGAGDYSGGSFARYISWKVAESETNKTCYVDQVNGDDATGEPGNSAKPFRSLSTAVRAVPQGGRVTIIFLSDYTLIYDEDVSGRQVRFDLNGYQLSTQWYASQGSVTYAAAYRIWAQNSQIYFKLDTRNGAGSQLYIPRRDTTLATYPLQPTRSGLFYVPQDAPASFSFTIRADNTSTVPPIYVGDSYLIHTSTWSYDRYPRLSVSIGAHYGSAAAANAIVLDKTNMDTKLVQSSYACDYSFQGAIAVGSRLFVDQAGSKIAHADAVAIDADTTYNRAARSINYFFSDGSHPGNTWGECGNVIIYDTAGVYTYTPTSGIRGIVVTLIGGGGGGAYGSFDSSANYGYGGEGGENGGMVKIWIPADEIRRRSDTSFTVTVGSGGAAGTNTSKAGGDGEDTSISGNTSGINYAIAYGGLGGQVGYNGNRTAGFSGYVSTSNITLLTNYKRKSQQGVIMFVGSGNTNEFLRVPGGNISLLPTVENITAGGGALYGGNGQGGAGGDVEFVNGSWSGYNPTNGGQGAVIIEEYF